MTKYQFLKNIDDFAINIDKLPEFNNTEDIDIDFSLYLNMDELKKEEIFLEDFETGLLYEKLQEVKEQREREWGSQKSTSNSLNLREYVNIDKLEKKDYSFARFEKLAVLYRFYLRKQRMNTLSYAEKRDMESVFNKLLACMIHFFTKRENYHLKGSGAAVDMDDFDSVIAMTLIRCLKLQDKSADEIIASINLDEADCFLILSELNIPLNFYESPKVTLFKTIMKMRNYSPSYLADGVAYYDLDIVKGFYNSLLECAISANVEFVVPKLQGFDPDKSSFRKYITASICKELYKLYRWQIPVHVPAKVRLDENISAQTQAVPIFNAGEAVENGINPAASSYIEFQQFESFVQKNGASEMTKPTERIEKRTLNKILCDRIMEIPDGEIVLYHFGIEMINGNYYAVEGRRSYAETAEHFNQDLYTVKYAVKRVGRIFKKKYPDFYIEYFSE